MSLTSIALLIIDVQRYYTEASAPLLQVTESMEPGGTRYIRTRIDTIVIPNIQKLLVAARHYGCPVIFARLCGLETSRRDLHQNFYAYDLEAYKGHGCHVYPLASEPLACVDPRIMPLSTEFIIDKTGYSAFHQTCLRSLLKDLNVDTVVLTGLTTSQCVNTTARAAADWEFRTLMVEDAQADYDRDSHEAALLSSEAMTGRPYLTEEIIEWLAQQE